MRPLRMKCVYSVGQPTRDDMECIWQVGLLVLLVREEIICCYLASIMLWTIRVESWHFKDPLYSLYIVIYPLQAYCFLSRDIFSCKCNLPFFFHRKSAAVLRGVSAQASRSFCRNHCLEGTSNYSTQFSLRPLQPICSCHGVNSRRFNCNSEISSHMFNTLVSAHLGKTGQMRSRCGPQ